MIKYLVIAAALLAVPAFAQTPVAGVVGMGVTAPYSPAGAMLSSGTTPSGLGQPTTLGSPVSPALPQPATGIIPPVGETSAGTIGDGRVGTLAPGGAVTPGVNGMPGTPTTAGVAPLTPTTNPPPR